MPTSCSTMKGSTAALASLLLLALCSSAVAQLGELGLAVSLCLGAHPCLGAPFSWMGPSWWAVGDCQQCWGSVLEMGSLGVSLGDMTQGGGCVMGDPCKVLEGICGISPGLCFSLLPDGLPTTCCFSYVQRPIPRNLIASAYITSSKCRLPAVILVTRKGKEICANPEEPWVQKRLELLQKQEN
ncbi:hypothetical protein CIB84_000680 [Bambusicola thoracicus]|uniref:Chemokine interleukin-8-like domain-containing protein n=1 Tax=Bambusicola thoracicus TaxID=9083 RepID=A0A2P4TGT1_BAMTH|nr:hypothetical protein CIB84_000680 [Bambusicola thoracicus]